VFAPKYESDGSPSVCYARGAVDVVAPSVKACSELEGTVEVVFDFQRDGVPSKVHADVECDGCRLPRAADERVLLECVEKAASAARLPLEDKQDTATVIYRYQVGAPEDPRLGVGWAPMDDLTMSH
jgi:hypothetical protein